MNKMRKSRASKVIAGFVGFATAVTMSFGTASAATTEELQAQIASLLATITSLQAQLSTMQGGTTGTTVGGVAYTFAKNLKMGDTGTDVMNLQKVLNMNVATQVSATGAGSPGMESTYFGAKTKAAVIKFQELHMAEILTPVGLTKGTGFVGASSRALLNTMTVGTGTGTGGVVSTGPVSVMLSADTPATGVIVVGQATADLAHFTFTGAGTVNSVMLKRSGISDQNTLSNVYLYDGATRITDGYSFNTNGEITINNLGLVVNGMKVISVKADVASTATSGQTIAVALTSFTSGVTATTINIMGNTMSLAAGGTLATASMTANTANGGPTATPTVNAGVTGYTFWSAPLQINTRTVSLKNVAFRMIGSAPADALSDIKLFIDGVDSGKVGVVTPIQGVSYAIFDFMAAPMSLTTGSHTVDVRATVQKGSNRTVQFSLQQAADLMILDPQVGVNVAVTGTIPNGAATVTINTGSLTITPDPVFQAMTNVTGGASNVAIAKYKVHAYGEDVKITSLPVNIFLGSMTPAASGLDDVTLYFNGSQVGTQQDFVATNPLTFQLGSQLIAPAGTDSILEIRANIRTTASANYTAGTASTTLTLGSSNAQGQNSLATLNTPAVTGNTLTVQTGLLAVSKNTGYASQNAGLNTTGVKIGSFVLQNQSSSESVRITTLTISGIASASTTNISALRTSETSGSGATPVQPQTTNTFSVDFTLAPGATKTIDIIADTSSTADAITTILTVASIGVSSNVSSAGSPITGQTITLSSGTITNPPTLLTASATTAQYIAAGGAAGAVGATKAVYNFVSTGGSATITELKFTVGASAGTPISSVQVGSFTAPVVSGVAYLTGLNLNVPNGGSGLTQDVSVSYGEVGTNGTVPGTTASTSLTYVKYTSGGVTTTITPNVVAPDMTLVGSKPTVSVNTTQGTGLILGAENKIGEVTISADAKGNIKINDLKFSMGSSNITTFAITSPRIADGATTVTGSSCGSNVATTSIVFCEFATVGDTMASSTDVATLESNTDYDGFTVTAGTSKTLSLYGTVGGTITTGGGNTTVSSSVNSAGFNWDDTSTNGSSGKNLTGTLIYNFPTGSYSIKQ